MHRWLDPSDLRSVPTLPDVLANLSPKYSLGPSILVATEYLYYRPSFAADSRCDVPLRFTCFEYALASIPALDYHIFLHQLDTTTLATDRIRNVSRILHL
jgi:hypothetical protein